MCSMPVVLKAVRSCPSNPSSQFRARVAQSKSGSKQFRPANRLKIKADFDYVFARPNRRCSQGPLQAIFKETKSTDSEPAPLVPRLGLVIAKRHLPLAVQRNRVKRLVREGFRASQTQLPPLDIVVRLARAPESEVSAGDVAALFGKMLRSEINRSAP